ncbi:MAG: TVP38/TMEM64 family protein [Candidatus Binataceae bacterium]|jgi:uncharacterized membrane protein YdjX (TVP38/TMEM64 family)
MRDSSGKPLDRVSVTRLWVMIGCLVTIAVAMIVLPVSKILFSLFETAHAMGVWGPALIAAAYVPACLFVVPGMFLTIASGYLFGITTGAITAWIGSTAGATAAFIAGRVLARELVVAGMSGNPKRAGMDQAISDHGVRFAILTRLTPLIPFNLLNYVLGMSGISLGQFVLGSWIGLIPVTLMYAYLGTLLKQVEETGGADLQIAGSQIAPAIAGLVAIIAITVFVWYSIKTILDEATEPPLGVPGKASSNALAAGARNPRSKKTGA